LQCEFTPVLTIAVAGDTEHKNAAVKFATLKKVTKLFRPRALGKSHRRAAWFKELQQRLLTVKQRAYSRPRAHRIANPRAWKRILQALTLEGDIDVAVDAALVGLNSPGTEAQKITTAKPNAESLKKVIKFVSKIQKNTKARTQPKNAAEKSPKTKLQAKTNKKAVEQKPKKSPKRGLGQTRLYKITAIAGLHAKAQKNPKTKLQAKPTAPAAHKVIHKKVVQKTPPTPRRSWPTSKSQPQPAKPLRAKNKNQ
jgi:hypothetical protein